MATCIIKRKFFTCADFKTWNHELVLQNCNDTVLQPFLSETWLAAVLDSGASRTVSEKI